MEENEKKEGGATSQPGAEQPTTNEVPASEQVPPVEEVLPAEEIKTQDLRPGMTIRVHQKISEGDKERIQIFQGMITALRGKTPETKTMTVSKNSFGITVEKIFPIASPLIEKVEVVKQAKVRRAKLGFLKSYTKRLKETLVKA